MRFPFLVFLMTLTACAPRSENAQPLPLTDTPAAWSQGASGDGRNLRDWWERFGNRELAELQQKALAENLDITAATARIQQAEAVWRTAYAPLFPQGEVTGSMAGNRRNPSSGSASDYFSAAAGISVSYALDLFGRNTAAATAAERTAEAARFDQAAVALTVSATVAKTYAAVLALNERIYTARAAVNNADEALKMAQARHEAGTATTLDVDQQASFSATRRAAVAALEQSRAQARNALAVLTGAAPQNFSMTGDRLSALTPPSVAPIQPAELLERRPDIKRAEVTLQAADANIAAARAALYPSFSIGLDSSLAKSPLVDPASALTQIFAAMTAPVFDGGSRAAEVDRTRARALELASAYQKTVLQSFREVEDALTAEHTARRRIGALEMAAESARAAERVNEERYRQGLADRAAVLESTRAVLNAEDDLTLARLDRITAAIDLYAALGGGWKDQ